MNTTKNAVVEPYLFFEGRCEEAVEFYRKALGAEVLMVMRYKDAPDKSMIPPGSENKVMHASFRIGESTIMASDSCGEESAKFQGFSLSIAPTTEADADKYFNALTDGGKIVMPLAKTFWSPRFGMLTDRFGISWMINVTQ
jgi:PhnB protein